MKNIIYNGLNWKKNIVQTLNNKVSKIKKVNWRGKNFGIRIK